MFCARILAGIGTGGISAVIPVWSSELVSYDARGMVIAFEMLVNFAGISAAYWLEYLLSFLNAGKTEVRWRCKSVAPIYSLGKTSDEYFHPSPAWVSDDVRVLHKRLNIWSKQADSDSKPCSFLAALMICMLVMPESPRCVVMLRCSRRSFVECVYVRYDIGKGRRDRGRKTLALFRANGDIDDPRVIAEYEEIISAIGTCDEISGKYHSFD